MRLKFETLLEVQDYYGSSDFQVEAKYDKLEGEEYITQQDHTNEGKFLLVDALEDISFKENVNINLYYTVRDDHKTSNLDYLTKKGFELV